MIDPDNFNFFGYSCYACDTGITADSAQELFDKINWCHKNGIYKDRIPLQGWTIANVVIF